MSEAASGRLCGQVAVVTGGGTGIGAAIVRLFCAEGAAVVVAGRRLAPLEAIAAETGATAERCDVTSEEAVASLMATAAGRFGGIDILIANAGITGPVMAAEEMDIEAFEETLAINVRGLVLSIKHAAPHLKVRRGAIVVVGSRMGKFGYPMRSAYVASKFAAHGITESVAQELGPHGVRVNALAPGAVSGELMDRVVAARAAKEGRPAERIIAENYTDKAALRRWVSPEEVAEAALFLASAASAAITGKILEVDAGRM